MSNNYASYFNRIDFVVILSFIELPWSNGTLQLLKNTLLLNPNEFFTHIVQYIIYLASKQQSRSSLSLVALKILQND